MIINLSSTENLYLPKKHVVAFAEKDDTDGEVFEIDNLDAAPRNGFLSKQDDHSPSLPPSKQKLIYTKF